jgi:hypothetical protein
MKTIKLPDELHSTLKMYAMSKRVSLQDLIVKILQSSIKSDKPVTTPSELKGELLDYYKKNTHFVESTRTLMDCDLEEAILITMEAEQELKKFNL